MFIVRNQVLRFLGKLVKAEVNLFYFGGGKIAKATGGKHALGKNF